MRTAPALALLTVGAILAYAVNVSVPVLDLNVVGTVLALAGLLWLAVEIGIEAAAARRHRPRPSRPPEEEPAPPARDPAPYDPVIRPRRGDEAGKRQHPHGGSGDEDATRVMPRRRR